MPIRLLTVGSDPDNTLFGVDPDGTLRWFRYVGGAQADPAASTAPWLGWDPNSGNPIGNGWGDFSWLGAGIQGTLLGVDGQGDLRRYYYTGSGESDYNGDQNWDTQSGSVLATGFEAWKHLALIMNEGDYTAGTDDLQILAVDQSGDVWVYGFHNGVARPNTPVRVAQGWTDYEYLFSPNLGRVLAVSPSGVLYWLEVWVVYNEDGTVTTKLGPENGNAIGSGWNKFSSATAGFEHELEGTHNYIPIYAVDGNHNLHWYGYTGHGVDDPSGTTGWVTPNSGNIVSGSW
ncbi:MAG: tachylectin-related carbohydrate-binding protein [Mycobacterium sp.]